MILSRSAELDRATVNFLEKNTKEAKDVTSGIIEISHFLISLNFMLLTILQIGKITMPTLIIVLFVKDYM